MKAGIFVFSFIIISVQCVSQNLVVEKQIDTSYLTSIAFDVSEVGIGESPEPPTDTIINECIVSKGFEVEGKKTGEWRFNECFSNGRDGYMARGRSPLAILEFHDGRQHGKYMSFYIDSVLQSTFTYSDGLLNGEFQCYTITGRLLYSGTIDQASDKVYCIGKEYYSTGALKGERRFLIETLERDWINKVD